ncbi:MULTISPECIES: RrF2 family transcriptional regulator [Actibacterium]|uniref:Rrf2 family nitric oxide-sensitive transcriptional repressor n=1 Tax=Actibacterium naphthalenivorans TaxID=1614693 RepID=A0A840CJQ4_9RHOB|nr:MULTISPECIES: Rrf2 family transcriptional regulator [Actibacterium]ALG91023.1 Rrf2 family transcriptional regulator [Actibacterium sp. EMB200-NS6]MBB4023409.1 Rrf2 family nitric oxide-sensitive transcriptional repressor [Actibacterium naphthalenivorans]
MRLTTRTNIAMRALMYCAVNAGRVVRKSDIAQACNTSENHMAQVINSLSRFGLVKTTRGRHGGVTLEQPADQVFVGTVFRKLEAGVPFAECFANDTNTCPLIDCCRLRGVLSDALTAFYSSLDKVSLADLVAENTPLEQALLLR